MAFVSVVDTSSILKEIVGGLSGHTRSVKAEFLEYNGDHFVTLFYCIVPHTLYFLNSTILFVSYIFLKTLAS